MVRLIAAGLVAFPCAASAAAPAPTKPTVFAPGVISELVADSSPSFFPGDREVIFEHADLRGATLRLSRRGDDGWSAPVDAPFSGRWNDLEPAVAADGRSVVFVSSRPASGEGPQLTGHWNGQAHPNAGGNLWRVARDGNGWNTPTRLPDAINRNDAVFAPSLAADGTLYFMRTDDTTGRFRLFRARIDAAGTAEVAPLPFSDGSVADCDPAVAPDQSYLIFTSSRETPRLQLYIAFRDGDRWGTPRRLPDEINGDRPIMDPRISADQSTLYFSHDRVIWQTPLAPLLARMRDGAAAG